MALSNACFISFRHGERGLTQRFVREFYDGLAGELEAQLGREVGVFLDQQRLQGGDFFNEQIARDLCASSCFVMIYTPAYFSLTHSYQSLGESIEPSDLSAILAADHQTLSLTVRGVKLNGGEGAGPCVSQSGS